ASRPALRAPRAAGTPRAAGGWGAGGGGGGPGPATRRGARAPGARRCASTARVRRPSSRCGARGDVVCGLGVDALGRSTQALEIAGIGATAVFRVGKAAGDGLVQELELLA